MAPKLCVTALFLFCWRLGAQYVINTFAGGGAVQGVPALSAGIGYPTVVTKDTAGNLYIGSGQQYRIYKIDVNGTLTTIAGNGAYQYSGDGGPAALAGLDVAGIAVDPSGIIYVADSSNYRIRKITNGVITTFAGTGVSGASGDGGPAISAGFNGPSGIALDRAGNLYVADGGLIRKITKGVITTIGGRGTTWPGDGGPLGSAVVFATDIALDAAGNLYIADYYSNRIRKVTNGIITTIAGNGIMATSGDGGPATSASLNGPLFVSVDSSGAVYISQHMDGRVRRVFNGIITTVAGNGTFPGRWTVTEFLDTHHRSGSG